MDRRKDQKGGPQPMRDGRMSRREKVRKTHGGGQLKTGNNPLKKAVKKNVSDFSQLGVAQRRYEASALTELKRLATTSGFWSESHLRSTFNRSKLSRRILQKQLNKRKNVNVSPNRRTSQASASSPKESVKKETAKVNEIVSKDEKETAVITPKRDRKSIKASDLIVSKIERESTVNTPKSDKKSSKVSEPKRLQITEGFSLQSDKKRGKDSELKRLEVTEGFNLQRDRKSGKFSKFKRLETTERLDLQSVPSPSGSVQKDSSEFSTKSPPSSSTTTAPELLKRLKTTKGFWSPGAASPSLGQQSTRDESPSSSSSLDRVTRRSAGKADASENDIVSVNIACEPSSHTVTPVHNANSVSRGRSDLPGVKAKQDKPVSLQVASSQEKVTHKGLRNKNRDSKELKKDPDIPLRSRSSLSPRTKKGELISSAKISIDPGNTERPQRFQRKSKECITKPKETVEGLKLLTEDVSPVKGANDATQKSLRKKTDPVPQKNTLIESGKKLRTSSNQTEMEVALPLSFGMKKTEEKQHVTPVIVNRLAFKRGHKPLRSLRISERSVLNRKRLRSRNQIDSPQSLPSAKRSRSSAKSGLNPSDTELGVKPTVDCDVKPVHSSSLPVPDSKNNTKSKSDSSKQSGKQPTAAKSSASSNMPKYVHKETVIVPVTRATSKSDLDILDLAKSSELKRLETTDGFWSPPPKPSIIFESSLHQLRQKKRLKSPPKSPIRQKSVLFQHCTKKLKSLKKAAVKTQTLTLLKKENEDSANSQISQDEVVTFKNKLVLKRKGSTEMAPGESIRSKSVVPVPTKKLAIESSPKDREQEQVSDLMQQMSAEGKEEPKEMIHGNLRKNMMKDSVKMEKDIVKKCAVSTKFSAGGNIFDIMNRAPQFDLTISPDKETCRPFSNLSGDHVQKAIDFVMKDGGVEVKSKDVEGDETKEKISVEQSKLVESDKTKEKIDVEQSKVVESDDDNKKIGVEQSKLVESDDTKKIDVEQSKVVESDDNKKIGVEQSKLVESDDTKEKIDVEQSKFVESDDNKKIGVEQSKLVESDDTKEKIDVEQSKVMESDDNKKIGVEQSKLVESDETKEKIDVEQSKLTAEDSKLKEEITDCKKIDGVVKSWRIQDHSTAVLNIESVEANSIEKDIQINVIDRGMDDSLILKSVNVDQDQDASVALDDKEHSDGKTKENLELQCELKSVVDKSVVPISNEIEMMSEMKSCIEVSSHPTSSLVNKVVKIDGSTTSDEVVGEIILEEITKRDEKFEKSGCHASVEISHDAHSPNVVDHLFPATDSSERNDISDSAINSACDAKYLTGQHMNQETAHVLPETVDSIAPDTSLENVMDNEPSNADEEDTILSSSKTISEEKNASIDDGHQTTCTVIKDNPCATLKETHEQSDGEEAIKSVPDCCSTIIADSHIEERVTDSVKDFDESVNSTSVESVLSSERCNDVTEVEARVTPVSTTLSQEKSSVSDTCGKHHEELQIEEEAKMVSELPECHTLELDNGESDDKDHNLDLSVSEATVPELAAVSEISNLEIGLFVGDPEEKSEKSVSNMKDLKGSPNKSPKHILRKVRKRKINRWKKGVVVKKYKKAQMMQSQEKLSHNISNISEFDPSNVISQIKVRTVRREKKKEGVRMLNRLTTEATFGSAPILDESKLLTRTKRGILPVPERVSSQNSEMSNPSDPRGSGRERGGYGSGRGGRGRGRGIRRLNSETLVQNTMNDLSIAIPENCSQGASSLPLPVLKPLDFTAPANISLDGPPPVLTPQFPQSFDVPASFVNNDVEDDVVEEFVDESNFHLYWSDEEKCVIKKGSPVKENQSELENQPSVSTISLKQPKKLKGKRGRPPGIKAVGKGPKTARKAMPPRETLYQPKITELVRTFEFRKKTTRSPLEMLEMKRRQEEAIYDLQEQQRRTRLILLREKRNARMSPETITGEPLPSSEDEEEDFDIRPCFVVLNDFVKKLQLDGVFVPGFDDKEANSSPFSFDYEDDEKDEDWYADLEDIEEDDEEIGDLERRPHIPRLKLKRVIKSQKVTDLKSRNLVSQLKSPDQEPLKLVIKTEPPDENIHKQSAMRPASANITEPKHVTEILTTDAPINQTDLTGADRAGFVGSYLDFLKERPPEGILLTKPRRMKLPSAPKVTLAPVVGSETSKQLKTATSSSSMHVATEEINRSQKPGMAANLPDLTMNVKNVSDKTPSHVNLEKGNSNVAKEPGTVSQNRSEQIANVHRAEKPNVLGKDCISTSIVGDIVSVNKDVSQNQSKLDITPEMVPTNEQVKDVNAGEKENGGFVAKESADTGVQDKMVYASMVQSDLQMNVSSPGNKSTEAPKHMSESVGKETSSTGLLTLSPLVETEPLATMEKIDTLSSTPDVQAEADFDTGPERGKGTLNSKEDVNLLDSNTRNERQNANNSGDSSSSTEDISAGNVVENINVGNTREDVILDKATKDTSIEYVNGNEDMHTEDVNIGSATEDVSVSNTTECVSIGNAIENTNTATNGDTNEDATIVHATEDISVCKTAEDVSIGIADEDNKSAEESSANVDAKIICNTAQDDSIRSTATDTEDESSDKGTRNAAEIASACNETECINTTEDASVGNVNDGVNNTVDVNVIEDISVSKTTENAHIDNAAESIKAKGTNIIGSASEDINMVGTNVTANISISSTAEDVSIRNTTEDVSIGNTTEDVDVRDTAEFASIGNTTEDVDIRDTAEDASIGNTTEDVSNRKTNEDISMGNTAEDVCIGNIAEDVCIDNTAEDVSIRKTTEDVSMGNTAEDVSIGNTAKDVNIGNTTEDVNIGNTTEDHNIGNTTEDVNIGNTTEDVNIGKATDTTKDVNIGNTTEDVNIGNTTEDHNIGNTTEDVSIGNTTEDMEGTTIPEDVCITNATEEISISSVSEDTNIDDTTKDISIDTQTSNSALTAHSNNNNEDKLSSPTDPSNSPVHSTSNNSLIENDQSSKLKVIMPQDRLPSSFRYTCRRCGFSSVTKLTIESHIYTHIPGAQFQCATCQIEFSSLVAAASHLKNAHLLSNQKLHITGYVDETHFYEKSDNLAKGEQEKNPISSVSSQISSGAGGQSPPFIISVVVSGGAGNRAVRAGSGNQRRYVCSHCGFSTNVRDDIEQHVSDLHSSQGLYTCTLCDESVFSSEDNIKQHCASVHPSRPKPYRKLPDFYDAAHLAKMAQQKGSQEECGSPTTTNIYRVSSVLDVSDIDSTSPVDHKLKAKEYLYMQDDWNGKKSVEADSTTGADYSEETPGSCSKEDDIVDDTVEEVSETTKASSVEKPSVEEETTSNPEEVEEGASDLSLPPEAYRKDIEVDTRDGTLSVKIAEVVSLSELSASYGVQNRPEALSSLDKEASKESPEEATSTAMPTSETSSASTFDSPMISSVSAFDTQPEPQDVDMIPQNPVTTTSIDASSSSTGAAETTSSIYCSSLHSKSSHEQSLLDNIVTTPTAACVRTESVDQSGQNAVASPLTVSPSTSKSAITPPQEGSQSGHKKPSPAQPQSDSSSLTPSTPVSSSSSSSAPGGLPLSYKCKACKVHTPYLLMMVKHLKSRHSNIRCFSCPYCKSSSSFVSQKQLRHHVRSQHPSMVDKNEISLSKEANILVEAMVLPYNSQCTRVGNRLVLEEDIHTCTLCSIRMTSMPSVYDHLKEKHSDLFEFICPVCQAYKSKSLQDISNHCISQHDSNLDKDKFHVSVPKYLFMVLKCISANGKYIEKALASSGASSTSKSSASGTTTTKTTTPASLSLPSAVSAAETTVSTLSQSTHSVVDQRQSKEKNKTMPQNQAPQKERNIPTNFIGSSSLSSSQQQQSTLALALATPTGTFISPIVALPVNHPGIAVVGGTPTQIPVNISSSLFDTSSLAPVTIAAKTSTSPDTGSSSNNVVHFSLSTVSGKATSQPLRSKSPKNSGALPVLNVPSINKRSDSSSMYYQYRQQQGPGSSAGSFESSSSSSTSQQSAPSSHNTAVTTQPQPPLDTDIEQLPEKEPNPDAFKIFNLRPSVSPAAMPQPSAQAAAAVMSTGAPSVFPPVSSSHGLGFIPGPMGGFPAAMVIPPNLVHNAFPFAAANVRPMNPGVMGINNSNSGNSSTAKSSAATSISGMTMNKMNTRVYRPVNSNPNHHQQPPSGYNSNQRQQIPAHMTAMLQKNFKRPQKADQSAQQQQQIAHQNIQSAHQQQLLRNMSPSSIAANFMAPYAMTRVGKQPAPPNIVPVEHLQRQFNPRDPTAWQYQMRQPFPQSHQELTSQPQMSAAPVSVSSVVGQIQGQPAKKGKRGSQMYQCPYCPHLVELRALDVASHIQQIHPGKQVTFQKVSG